MHVCVHISVCLCIKGPSPCETPDSRLACSIHANLFSTLPDAWLLLCNTVMYLLSAGIHIVGNYPRRATLTSRMLPVLDSALSPFGLLVSDQLPRCLSCSVRGFIWSTERRSSVMVHPPTLLSMQVKSSKCLLSNLHSSWS